MAKNIITNAKVRRVSVCDALDTLILHRDLLPSLPELMSTMGEEYAVEVFADEQAYTALDGRYAGQLRRADEAHFGTEFLSMKMSIKIVDSLEQALGL
jgi:glutamate-5-semialdehyde dehydrogenase